MAKMAAIKSLGKANFTWLEAGCCRWPLGHHFYFMHVACCFGSVYNTFLLLYICSSNNNVLAMRFHLCKFKINVLNTSATAVPVVAVASAEQNNGAPQAQLAQRVIKNSTIDTLDSTGS